MMARHLRVVRNSGQTLLATLAMVICTAANSGPAWTVERRPPPADAYADKSRLFVLTDIGNEPDDQMSFIRLLLYANEIDIEGVAATTSIHLPNETHPETLTSIIDTYGSVRPMLLKNAEGWPSAADLRSRISSGPKAYGMAAIDAAHPSSGALALIAAVDRADGRPLWVAIWGGANVLAEALERVRVTRTPAALAKFVAKLRIYSISDQDDAGLWIRRGFPNLRYIVSPSSDDVLDYGSATWSGISGDVFYRNGDGADSSIVTNGWLGRNVRKGPLGGRYPYAYAIMEGDTPSFLNLIPNGLGSAMSPGWGGWGGRYIWRRHPLAGGPIWTQGGFPSAGLDSRDEVGGIDGRLHRSDQATIWRWRSAFQNDFAARMDWTIKPFAEANHPPVPVVNGSKGLAPITMQLTPGGVIDLDASASYDKDRGQALIYRWSVYQEAGSTFGRILPKVSLTDENNPRARIASTCTSACKPGEIHVILQITDDGTPALTRYRRVIIQIHPDKPDRSEN